MTTWWAPYVTMAATAVMMIIGRSGAAAQAQGPAHFDPDTGMSLDQAIAAALEREPSLHAARAEVAVRLGERIQAGLRPNPSLSFEQREEPAGRDRQTTVMVQWPLDLFRRPGRVAVADRQVSAAQQAAADRARMLAADVRAAYGDVLVALRDVSVLAGLLTAVRTEHDLLRARVSEGASPPLDRDLLRVELQRLESDRLLQDGRLEQAVLGLKRLLGMGPGDQVGIRDTLAELVGSSAVPPNGELAADSALAASRPDVREAETLVAAAEARVDAARREGRVDVSVYGSYMRMSAGFAQRGFAADGRLEPVSGVFHYVAGGAMLMLPLRQRNQGEVASAQAERTAAAARHDAARLSAEHEIAAARVRLESARKAVGTYDAEALKLARANLSVVSQTYELGRASVFDVLAEQRRYLELERAYTETLREAYEAQTALGRATGELE
jgi:cobalt-zinc-cadmium efflux system outer membrane protein